MKKSISISILVGLVGLPSAIIGILTLSEHPVVLPIVEGISLGITLPLGIILLIIIASFISGMSLIYFKNRSTGWTYRSMETSRILADLRKNHGSGFNQKDAHVMEAYGKGNTTKKDISIFTNMSEKKIQKIMDKLAKKKVPGFKWKN